MKPTYYELWNEELEEVNRISKTGWRHGTTETVVFYRASDNTFWQAIYQLSTDGETNDLRDGYARINQVIPRQIVSTVYDVIKEESITAAQKVPVPVSI